MAVDETGRDGQAVGIVARNLITGAVTSHSAHAVVLATGGYGNVFFLSTNAKASNVTAIWRAIQSGDPGLAEQCCVDHIKAAAVAALSMIEQASVPKEKAAADE